MSRPLRIEYPNAYYHVMNRGRGRGMIFHGPEYYEVFLKTLAEAYERFNLEAHAYCLLGNHYHLLVKTPDGNLQRAMRHVSGVYTQRYNRLKKTDGSLFRGRYKAILVDADEYLLHLSRYIHRNPIEAGLVEKLSDYNWSSYPYYVGAVKRSPNWLITADVYGQLQIKRMFAKKYQKFVEGKNGVEDIDEFYSKERQPPVLGGENFINDVRILNQSALEERTYDERKILKPSIKEIIDQVRKEFGVDSQKIYRSERGRGAKNTPRSVAMYLAQQVGDWRLSDIAQEFSLKHYGGVSNAIYRLKQEMSVNSQLTVRINRIIKRFDP